MYGGKEEWVRIECDNSFAGVMIDRFGKDVKLREEWITSDVRSGHGDEKWLNLILQKN